MPVTRFLRRIGSPPTTGDRGLDRWLRDLATELNQFPNFSTSSTTDGPESIIAAPPGTLYIEGNSSVTTHLWFKSSGTDTTGWSQVSLI